MRLNLGSGAHHLDGWASVDMRSDAQQRVDLSSFPWPWADDSIDEVLASHVLEHLTKAAGRQFVAECYRILAPGGRLYVAVPDMDLFITARISGDFSQLNGYKWADLNHMLGGDETEENELQRHKYMYTRESLQWLLEDEWFEAYPREALGFDNPEYECISLYMTGIKNA